ncbi:MAG: serine hydrolase [Ignavibacteriaceae bacterium]|nr:serine hydrolase [Ignavibacteriaceae bacterium]
MTIQKTFAALLIWIFIIPIFAFVPPGYYTEKFLKEENKMEHFNSADYSSYPPMFKLNNDDINWVETTLAGLSLRDKCAQMIMPWTLGNYVSEESTDYQRVEMLVKESKVGGLIFFKGDVTNEALLINKMQRMSDLPLLISSDFERGLAMRLSDATEFPYNMALGATGNPHLAYEMGRAVADECRALGVHQNYAPVADVNNNALNPIINIRSYSEDINIVKEFSEAFIKGTEERNVLTTAKHFPGHGNTMVDSHQDLPTIYGSQEELFNNELVPFIAAIKAGVHSVMVAHLEVPAFEKQPGIPATLSKSIITGLLKEKLNFRGLVCTDAMNMSAVTKNFSVGEAAVKAVLAGNDLVLMPPDEDVALNAIYDAVLNGEIDRKQIDESVRKILAAKRWLKIENNRYSEIDNLNKSISTLEHINLAKKIAEESITLVKNEKNLIPIDPGKYSNTLCITLSDGIGTDGNRAFQHGVQEKFPEVKNIFLNKRSKKKDYDKAINAARRADLILLPAYIRVKAYQGTVSLSELQEDFVNKLLRLKIPVVTISFGNPYLLSAFPSAKIYLCAYGDSKASQTAMLEAIVGINPTTGKLPISIPNTEFVLGHGLESSTNKLIAVDTTDDRFNFTRVNNLMNNAVENKISPGGVLLAAKNGKIVYTKSFGKFTYDDTSRAVTKDAIFDLASLSKVIGTTSAAMFLYDENKLRLEDKVSKFFPEFAANGKKSITIRNLLVHNSGLIAYRNFRQLYNSPEEVINAIIDEKLEYPTETKTVYSDLNMIVLQQVIEKITGKKLDDYLNTKLFEPLGMTRTMYNPPYGLWYYIPPTSRSGKPGVVHDGNAAILNGVAGHAGLFSTADDLAIFMQLLLQRGKYGSKQIFKQKTIDKFTTLQSKFSTRALGWDTPSESGSSAGEKFSLNSFGHTGFTGTSVWADKEKNVFIILLTNRVYPDGMNTEIINFRPLLHNELMIALGY